MRRAWLDDRSQRFKTNGVPWFRQRRLLNTIIFTETPGPPNFPFSGLDFRSLYVLIPEMTNRPASWRMPTPQQMEKLAAEAARRPAVPVAAPDDPLPAEYWDSILRDPRAGANGNQLRQRRLAEIKRHMLRVACRRCLRTVEIETVDALRL
jgi:hypothetical protein